MIIGILYIAGLVSLIFFGGRWVINQIAIARHESKRGDGFKAWFFGPSNEEIKKRDVERKFVEDELNKIRKEGE